MLGSLADQFQALSTLRQCERAMVACSMALEPWETLLPEEGVGFIVAEAFLFGRLEGSFGREVLDATRRHRDRLGQPMASELEQLCLDVDLAITWGELSFGEPALEWAAYGFMNLVLAATGRLAAVSAEIPFQNPFLLPVNQAITAVAFFLAKRAGEAPDRSLDSIRPGRLEAVLREWWERCESLDPQGERAP